MPHTTRYPSPPSSAGRSNNSRRDNRQRERDTRPEVPDFRFCVELGIILRSRQFNHKSSHDLETELSAQLTLAGVANSIASPSTEASSREWTIAPELCIPSRPKDHRFGIRLVSPFMRFARGRHESWISKISTLYQNLNKNFEVTSSHQCFTHIHIVPAVGFWTLSQLKSLSKSALYFERCLDELVPPYRRRSVWAKSNRYNKYFGDFPTMSQCFKHIDKQAAFEGLAARMNWCGADSPTGVALSASRAAKRENPATDFAHDAFRWAFGNIAGEGDGFGTVEFRQAPGSSTSSEAVTWIMLVGCFARIACTLGDSIKPEDSPQTKSLGEWLLYEASWCGLPHHMLLENLLAQAIPTSPTPGKIPGMDADAITIDEDQRLRWKHGERKIGVDKYRRMLKHI